MNGAKGAQRPSLLAIIALTGGLVWVSAQLGPLVVGGELRLWAALVMLLAGVGCLRVVIRSLELLVKFIYWHSAHTPSGLRGTAGWARLSDIKQELIPINRGPFWGITLLDPIALFSDYVSNAMTLAPAGSGKGICTVVPMGISIRASKIFADFKGELVCMLKPALEALGETVRVLNPARLWEGIIGEGDAYNVLDLIADDLIRPGGLRDVPGDLRELARQLQHEPSEGESENTYFREGGRILIGLATIIEVMINLHDATLASVALLLEDRLNFESNLRWIVGIDLEGKPHKDGAFPFEKAEWAKYHSEEDLREFAELIRARAANVLTLMSGGDTRTFDSFVTGAQQVLSVFAFGRLAPSMGRSTFRMSDLKEGDKPTTLFIVADASRMESFMPYIGLMQWSALTAIKRHPNKERPVYFILDEATNYRIAGLESLLTWGRSYGLRLHVIFQSLTEFERVYGRTALDTLLSETEVKQFLPGQRSPRALELISKKLLGEQSVMSANLALQDEQPGARESFTEAGRALMTEDEVRRTRYGVLIVRRCRPIRFDPVSYAEVEPWKDQVDVNPFYGKPFRKQTRLKL